jgi:hypothetical protein
MTLEQLAVVERIKRNAAAVASRGGNKNPRGPRNRSTIERGIRLIAKGFTQKEAAKLVGVPFATLHTWNARGLP